MKALFSIANEYNQPSNNLVCLYDKQPSFDELAKVLNTSFPCVKEEDTILITKLWQGKEIKWGTTEYRLETITFNTVIKEK